MDLIRERKAIMLRYANEWQSDRIADLEKQLAESQAEVERLNKLHAECPDAQAMEYRRGMERAAEIVEGPDFLGQYPEVSEFQDVADAIRAEIYERS